MDLSLKALDGFKRRLIIDKTALDDELIEQPSLFFEVSERLSYSKAERDEARRQRDLVAAEIKADLREDDPKLSESRLNSMVEEDRNYRLARASYHEAEKLVSLWESMTDAVRSRGYMLRQLADLFVANYYSPNSAGESLQDKRQRSERRTYRQVEERKETIRARDRNDAPRRR